MSFHGLLSGGATFVCDHYDSPLNLYEQRATIPPSAPMLQVQQIVHHQHAHHHRKYRHNNKYRHKN